MCCLRDLSWAWYLSQNSRACRHPQFAKQKTAEHSQNVEGVLAIACTCLDRALRVMTFVTKMLPAGVAYLAPLAGCRVALRELVVRKCIDAWNSDLCWADLRTRGAQVSLNSRSLRRTYRSAGRGRLANVLNSWLRALQAVASAALVGAASAAHGYDITGADIINFALNLECLEVRTPTDIS
jgi:hypothetical protein